MGADVDDESVDDNDEYDGDNATDICANASETGACDGTSTSIPTPTPTEFIATLVGLVTNQSTTLSSSITNQVVNI